MIVKDARLNLVWYLMQRAAVVVAAASLVHRFGAERSGALEVATAPTGSFSLFDSRLGGEKRGWARVHW